MLPGLGPGRGWGVLGRNRATWRQTKKREGTGKNESAGASIFDEILRFFGVEFSKKGTANRSARDEIE
jgi:hypothetical protein